MIRQDKLFEIFKEHHHWQDVMEIRTVGDFNNAVDTDHSIDLINISEALQEKKIAHIADEIAKRKGVKLILLAGPSSSGKTTTCKRLSIQLIANGLRPLQISLDDYFVDREQSPRDEKGDYDFESIHALNLKLINEQFNALFNGEEVELPRYDFPTGKSVKSGNKLKMEDNNVLVVEGIHALNPELTAVSYTHLTCTAAAKATGPWAFNNGFSIMPADESKTYQSANGGIKYSAGVQYTITLPAGVSIKHVEIVGYNNYADADSYIAELNGKEYGETEYVFPQKTTDGNTVSTTRCV